MIVGNHGYVFNVSYFTNGLNRAVRGLVRVTNDPTAETSLCSGWLVTDTLVVIPNYAVVNDTVLCVPNGNSSDTVIEPITATLISTFPTDGNNSTPALFRLSSPLAECALELETRSPLPGDPIIVLQHGEGSQGAQFSMGSILSADNEWIDYNASSVIGSGGGPVLDMRSWKIIGMHMLSVRDEQRNRGRRIDPVLDALRETSAWLEIVTFHNLAEAAYTALEDIPIPKKLRFKKRMQSASLENVVAEDHMMKAALSWSFDPEKISEEEKKELQPLVVDAKAGSWTLKAKERQRILKTAASPEEMSDQMPDEAVDETGQAVIKDILKGAPYKLDEIEEEQLSYWLQAVRWFDGLVPDLPSPAEVNTTLERKRTRSKLQNVIRGFRGRKKELEQLDNWYKDATAGPLLITGIGGMGKSALVGYFVNSLSADTLLLWLDFDRPDLAPDDAVSVLNAIIKQATIQLAGFEPPEMNEDNWKEGARKLGELLAAATKNPSPPIMILDGFEVAQHTKEYHEIWQVLEEILAGAPRLKVIVSGRAPVKSLKLQNKEATPLPLKGLIDKDAEEWLRDRGINDDEVLPIVKKLAEGIPLRLKLAVRLIDAGEKVKDLPEKLPQEYITGYLYQRILYRVIDPELIPVVEDILVLRKCSKPMLVKILGDNVPQGLTAEQVYDRLSREMALVGDAENLYGSFVVAGNSDKLELRPEVRSATLRLLEMKDAAKVRAMDEKAVDWYKDQDIADVNNVAELIYHLLRLKRLDEARKIFRIDCVPLLRDAINELPEDANAERSWLEKQIGVTNDEPADNILGWEIQAALDIKNRLERGLVKDIDDILRSRVERTVGSPLLIYDAWINFRSGDLTGAIDKLENGKGASGSILRDQKIFQAFLLMQQQQWYRADMLLDDLQHKSWWNDRMDSYHEILLLKAARIKFSVDVNAELEVFRFLKEMEKRKDTESQKFLLQFLSPADVVTPILNDLITKKFRIEVNTRIEMPFNLQQLKEFRKKIEYERSVARLAIPLHEGDWSMDAIRKSFLSRKNESFPKEIFDSVFNIAYKGFKRWKLATSDIILQPLYRVLIEKKESRQLYESLAGVLPAFRGQEIKMQSFKNIDELIASSYNSNDISFSESATNKNLKTSERLLRNYIEYNKRSVSIVEDRHKDGTTSLSYHLDLNDIQLLSVLFFLQSPEPLEVLTNRILGLPENYKLIP
jgi:hypothetical protein